MNFVVPNFSIIIPEMAVLGMLCLILVVDLFVSDRLRFVSYFLTQCTIVAAFILTILQLGHPTIVSFDGAVIRDNLSSILKLVVYIATFFTLIYARDYNISRGLFNGEFYVLSLASMLGMMVMISGHDFISIYLGVELMSLPLYALIAMRKGSDTAPEGAIKYFITGALASGMMLYGLSILYGLTGSLNIAVVAELLTKSSMHVPMMLGMIFVVVGLMFKLGAVPFHMWVPDVYHGAPTSVTTLITGAPKVAAFAIVIRLLAQAMPSLAHDWQQLLIIVSILSMVLGNLLAIAQTNIKRMFAYSSIAHIGYMLLGIIAATSVGYSAAMVYIITYAVMAIGGFGLLAALSKDDFEVERIDDLRGLNSRNPWLAFMMLILLFSMAGIPPTLGFFAKLGVVEALIQVHMVWLACAAVLFAVIGAYYYIRVIKVMYFEEPTDMSVVDVPFDANIAISVNALVILLLGIFPSAFITMCRHAFGV